MYLVPVLLILLLHRLQQFLQLFYFLIEYGYFGLFLGYLVGLLLLLLVTHGILPLKLLYLLHLLPLSLHHSIYIIIKLLDPDSLPDQCLEIFPAVSVVVQDAARCGLILAVQSYLVQEFR